MTSRDAKYSSTTISYLEDGRRNVDMNIIEVRDGEAVIARLQWEVISGEIYKLWVHEQYRRQGLATQMWNFAHSLNKVINPKHSEWRTDDGDAWARSFGTPLPPRQHA